MNFTIGKMSLCSYVVYALVALFLCYAMLLQISPTVLSVQLMRDLQVDAWGFGLIAASYFVSYTLLQLVAGLLYDRVTSRIILTLAIVATVWGILFFGVAHSISIAVLGRFLMGAGSAFAFIGLIIITTRWFPPQYFAFLITLTQLLMVLGLMMGLTPFAILVDKYDWRPTMQGIAIIGAILAVLIWIFVHDKDAPYAKEKLPSLQLKQSLRTVFLNKKMALLAIYTFASYVPLMSFAILWAVPFVMTRYATNNIAASLPCLMLWLGMGIVSPLVGYFSDYIKRRQFLLSICAFLGLLISIVIIYLPQLPLGCMYFCMFALGMVTASQVLTFALVKDHSSPEVIGLALGFNNFAAVGGALILQPLIGYLLHQNKQQTTIFGVAYYSLAAFQQALLIIPVFFFISLIVSRFFIQDRR